ncbi:MAG: hypothetical protein IPK83_22315 [Planctomycetes bacterium]|nr:hypothetical protein [Planctomycetota bacterium]
MQGRPFIAVSDQAAEYAPNPQAGTGQNRTMIVYGFDARSDLRATQIAQQEDGLRFQVNGRFNYQIPSLGRHNVLNALAAIAIGQRFRLEHTDIAPVLAKFKAPKMRMQAAQHGAIYLINDAYNANPSSMRAAFEAMDHLARPGRRVLVLGDMRELGDKTTKCHQSVGRDAGASSANVIITVGSMARVMADGATSAAGTSKRIYPFPSIEALTDKLPDLLEPGDNVLLKASRGSRLERLAPIVEKCGLAFATSV